MVGHHGLQHLALFADTDVRESDSVTTGHTPRDQVRNMKAYAKPELKRLGTMAAVTRKSGPAFDVESMSAAQAEGYDPCEFYPFHFCP